LKSKIQTKISQFLPVEIKQLLKRKLKEEPNDPFRHIRHLPRFTPSKVTVEGQNITIPDNASFLFMYEEIFNQEIYKFKSQSDRPYIIDGGANIGLATIYFKTLFPQAKVIAFEPDEKIFEYLRYNIAVFEFDQVQLIQKGLWKEEKEITFWSEGADGGRLNTSATDITNTSIQVTSLRSFLQEPVDFLKLDIEGAEVEVLSNIADLLFNVDHLFIEYHSFVGKPQQFSVIINILTEAGFRMYISSPGLSSKSPFVKVNTYNGMDMQLNIYAIRKD